MSPRELLELRDHMSQHKGRRFLCVATTANINNPPLLIGSARIASDVFAGNIILRDASFLPQIESLFSPVVDLFLIDCEVKGGVGLMSAALETIPPDKLHFFKPNDFTVEALDEWVAQRILRPLGVRVAVVGAGNIGTKTAFRLAERGFHVYLAGREPSRVSMIVCGLKQVFSGAGLIEAALSVHEACRNAHVVLGCTAGVAAIDEDAIESVDPRALLIDVGNGTFTRDAIAKARERSLNLEVLAPTAGWDGFIQRFLSTRELQRGMGRRMLREGLWIVSRGIMGATGDVLVDNIDRPTRIIGVCNGAGDLLYGEDAERQSKYVEQEIGNV